MLLNHVLGESITAVKTFADAETRSSFADIDSGTDDVHMQTKQLELCNFKLQVNLAAQVLIMKSSISDQYLPQSWL
jgi:hypothetical protein